LLGDAVSRRDLRERVEADADEVERPDGVFLERGEVVRSVAPGEDRRVMRGCSVLTRPPSSQDLRQLLDPRRFDAAIGEELGGSAGDELDVQLGEPARELSSRSCPRPRAAPA
jgi:hypothetical protein